MTCFLCTKATPVLVHGVCTKCWAKVEAAFRTPVEPDHCEMCGLPLGKSGSTVLGVCSSCDPTARMGWEAA